MLTAVDDVMQDDEVRVITDTVTTTSANIVGVNVVAEIYLYPDSSANVLEGIEAAIRSGVANEGGLGWDLTLSWLIKNIHVDGVQRVELVRPTANQVDDGTISIGSCAGEISNPVDMTADEDAGLPPSSSLSTARARDLSGSMNTLERLAAGAELIRTAKRANIQDSVVPWLIYEYGLGELLPYLSDQRTASCDGCLWQRLRGTPQSFRIALGWIGNDGTIEESEGGTINWAQFQIGPRQRPTVDLSQRFSRGDWPAFLLRFVLRYVRIYGGWYDGRRFKLDEHLLSGLDPLCDHTGVYLKQDREVPAVWPHLPRRAHRVISGDLSQSAWHSPSHWN